MMEASQVERNCIHCARGICAPTSVSHFGVESSEISLMLMTPFYDARHLTLASTISGVNEGFDSASDS